MKLSFLSQEITNIHSAAFLLGAAGLFSRLLGVLRDRMLAGHFGAGRELDIYYTAFQLPDFISVILLLGAGSAAILPVFQERLAKNREEARRLISSLCTLFLIGSAVLCILAFVFASLLIKFLAPGFLQSEQQTVVDLTRVMLLSPILLGLSGIFSAVVQSFQRFWAYALAPIFYNIGIIFGILILVPRWGLWGLSVGVVIGAFLHFLIQAGSATQSGFGFRFLWPNNDVAVKKVLTLSFPRVLAISLSNLTTIVLVALSSTLMAGSISIFNFAQNLYSFPVYIFAVSYATVIFPRLSKAYINHNKETFFHEFFLSVRAILFWIIPSMVLFIVLRAHIVRVAYGAGAFSWEDTRLTAAALAALVIAMCAASLITLFLRAFYALESTWAPLLINITASLLSIGLAFLFAFTLSHSWLENEIKALFRTSDLPNIQIVWLSLGFAIGNFLDMVFMGFALLRLAKKKFKGSPLPFPWAPLLKIIGAAIGAGFVTYGVRASFSQTLPLITFVEVFVQGVIAGLCGVGAYFGLLYLFRSEDLYSFWKITKSRLFRIGVLPKSWSEEPPDLHNP